jgi:Flp pilus assembly protein TadD
MSRKKRNNAKTPAGLAATPSTQPAEKLPAAKDGASPPRRRFAIAAIITIVVVAAVFAAYQWSESRTRSVTAKSAAPPTAATTVAAHFVGETECASCHAPQHAAWKGSDHDLAMQVADDKSVLGNFGNARFSYAGTTSTFLRRDGKFVVNTDGPDGKLHDYEIKYAFGVHPLQQYLIEFPGGRMQALSIAWDSRPKAQGGQRWFHLYPGQNIKAGDPLHWTGINQNWNFQCAECHSTNLRKNFDAKAETFNTTWSELNVACEACHGPGSNHVAWAYKQGDWHAFDANMGLAVALDERKGITWTPVAETGNAKRSAPRQTTREIDTCARCHSRASRISDDYVHGKPPLDSHRLALLDDNLYWNDGQMRDEVYNWGSFAQSRMHANGVTCADCHEPHSLKLRAQGNAVCAQCHQPAKYDLPTHTHHAQGTPGAACAACHMPTTTYMVVDPRHDHSMRIPRPDISAKLGTPNACTNCHAKQTAQWAADAIAQWTGKPPASFQHFADALRADSIGAAGARGALLTLLDDKSEPAIVRATAAQRLAQWSAPTTTDALARALNDPDSLVRLAAVESLGASDTATRQRYLARMVDDPVLAVRIEAARALSGEPEQGLTPSQRASFQKALAEYVAAQTYNADRPEGRMGLGNLYAQRGDGAAAITEYRKAIALDPTFVAAYANLADFYRSRGAEAEAEQTLREGIAHDARAAALHYALGLLYVREKRAGESLAELRSAAQFAPANARYSYVYAVALHDGGQPKEALKVLNAAMQRNGNDRDVLSALVQYEAQAGNREVAIARARQLTELDPENAEYARMLKQMEGGGT